MRVRLSGQKSSRQREQVQGLRGRGVFCVPDWSRKAKEAKVERRGVRDPGRGAARASLKV